MVSAIMHPVSHNPDRVQPYPFQAQLTVCIDARGLKARSSNSAAVRGTQATWFVRFVVHVGSSVRLTTGTNVMSSLTLFRGD